MAPKVVLEMPILTTPTTWVEEEFAFKILCLKTTYKFEPCAYLVLVL